MVNAIGMEATGGAIGYAMWWDLRLKNNEPRWRDVRDWALANGLTKEQMPEKSDMTTFTTACRSATFHESKDRVRLVEAGKTRDKSGNTLSVTFAVERTSPRMVNDQWVYDVDPVIVDRLTFAKDAPTPISVEKGTPEAMQVVAEAQRMMELANASYCRAVIQKLMYAIKAFPLRDQGGIMFVPVAQETVLNNLASVLPQWGTSQLHAIPTHQDGAQAVGSAAAEHFWGEVVRLQNDLKEMTAPTEKKRRGSTFDNRLSEYADVRDRVQFYADLLGDAKNTMLTALDELTAQCRKAIAENT